MIHYVHRNSLPELINRQTQQIFALHSASAGTPLSRTSRFLTGEQCIQHAGEYAELDVLVSSTPRDMSLVPHALNCVTQCSSISRRCQLASAAMGACALHAAAMALGSIVTTCQPLLHSYSASSNTRLTQATCPPTGMTAAAIGSQKKTHMQPQSAGAYLSMSVALACATRYAILPVYLSSTSRSVFGCSCSRQLAFRRPESEPMNGALQGVADQTPCACCHLVLMPSRYWRIAASS